MSNKVMAISIPIAVSGDNHAFHMERYAEKLKVNPGDCGIDLFPFKIEPLKNYHNSWFNKIIIDTGFVCVVPPGSFIYVHDRSSTKEKLCGYSVDNAIVDAHYTGNLKIRITVDADRTNSILDCVNQAIADKVALAQAVPVITPIIATAQVGNIILPGTRGSRGFGSTDRRN